jgi:hypothetical protein
VGSIVGFLTNGEKMKSKQVKWTSLVGVFALVGMSFLSACGDDSASPLAPQVSEKESSSSMQKNSSSVQRTSVKTTFELGKCSYDNESEKIFVSDEGEFYTCSYKNGDYTWVKPNNVKSSNSVAKVSSSSVLDEKIYYSSSSVRSEYNAERETFLYKEFFVEIDLTLFKQVSDNWEKQNSHKENYTDGDPRISFVIKTYSDDSLIDSVKTNVFNPGDNVGKWTGHEYFTKKFSGGVNVIYVCPVVYEYNVIESNVLHSSNYCYIIHDAGDKVDVPILQSDSKATDLKLEWAVTISYK